MQQPEVRSTPGVSTIDAQIGDDGRAWKINTEMGKFQNEILNLSDPTPPRWMWSNYKVLLHRFWVPENGTLNMKVTIWIPFLSNPPKNKKHNFYVLFIFQQTSMKIPEFCLDFLRKKSNDFHTPNGPAAWPGNCRSAASVRCRCPVTLGNLPWPRTTLKCWSFQSCPAYRYRSYNVHMV